MTKLAPRHCDGMAAHIGHSWELSPLMNSMWCPGTQSAEEECANPEPHDEHHWYNGAYGDNPFKYCTGRSAELPVRRCADPGTHFPHDESGFRCLGIVDTNAPSAWCGVEEEHDGHNWVGDGGGHAMFCKGRGFGDAKAAPDANEEEDCPEDMRYIRDSLVGEWWDLYHSKALDYNDGPAENHRELGIRGQFSDLHRKHGKLKKAIWDGKPLASEQPREILMDQISHCFLMLAMMDEEEGRRG